VPALFTKTTLPFQKRAARISTLPNADDSRRAELPERPLRPQIGAPGSVDARREAKSGWEISN
jgi:hypothetical protein